MKQGTRMAILEHRRTGERKEIEGEVPYGAIRRVEYEDENGELVQEQRVTMDGEEYIVIDDGVEMTSLDFGDKEEGAEDG